MGEVYYLNTEKKNCDSCLERQRLVGYIIDIYKNHLKNLCRKVGQAKIS